MIRMRFMSLLVVMLAMFSFSDAQSSTILLNGDTPGTGSNLDTTPLVTPYGIITFAGGTSNTDFCMIMHT